MWEGGACQQVAALYREDPRLLAYFRDGELAALGDVVEGWRRGRESGGEARARMLQQVLRGHNHVDLGLQASHRAASEAAGGGACAGAAVGGELASALASSVSGVVTRVTANSSWRPTAEARSAGSAAMEVFGVLGRVAGAVVGGVGTALQGGAQAGLQSRETFSFVDRVFLRATRDQAWELGARALDLQNARPSAEEVAARFRAAVVRELLRAGGSDAGGTGGTAAAASGGTRDSPADLLVWLRVVQLCLSLELVCQLPAPPERVCLPAEPLHVAFRMDEEYLNRRVLELRAALSGTPERAAKGMAEGDIAARCPLQCLAEPSGEACPVCLDAFEASASVRRLPCGHAMHRECCERWLREAATCPTCRRDVRR